MNNFDEYLRQGEPNRAEKASVWKTAIGLQQVDALLPSEYLITTARENIEGYITIEQVKERIDNYYKQHPPKNEENRTEEADKVSARVTEILSEKTFTFSPAEFITIHRRLFQDIYSHAGIIRDYNITKNEWVLNGETVLYASAGSLKATLEYDLQQEKSFLFKGLSQDEIIKHIAHFISFLWQIHIFGEGNTRTTAIFLIKYFRKLGFKDVNNDLFAEHSWFFRNALVRANYEDLSKGIYKTDEYLLRFLHNLLGQGNYLLKNRELHIKYDSSKNETLKADNDTVKVDNDTVNTENETPKAENDTVNIKNDTVKLENDTVNYNGDTLFDLIKRNNNITAVQISGDLKISLSTVKRRIKALKEKGLLERIGSDKTGYWKTIE